MVDTEHETTAPTPSTSEAANSKRTAEAAGLDGGAPVPLPAGNTSAAARAYGSYVRTYTQQRGVRSLASEDRPVDAAPRPHIRFRVGPTFDSGTGVWHHDTHELRQPPGRGERPRAVLVELEQHSIFIPVQPGPHRMPLPREPGTDGPSQIDIARALQDVGTVATLPTPNEPCAPVRGDNRVRLVLDPATSRAQGGQPDDAPPPTATFHGRPIRAIAIDAAPFQLFIPTLPVANGQPIPVVPRPTDGPQQLNIARALQALGAVAITPAQAENLPSRGTPGIRLLLDPQSNTATSMHVPPAGTVAPSAPPALDLTGRSVLPAARMTLPTSAPRRSTDFTIARSATFGPAIRQRDVPGLVAPAAPTSPAQSATSVPSTAMPWNNSGTGSSGWNTRPDSPVPDGQIFGLSPFASLWEIENASCIAGYDKTRYQRLFKKLVYAVSPWAGCGKPEFHIVLTGGGCGGKSAMMTSIKSMIEQSYNWRVVAVSEAATKVIKMMDATEVARINSDKPRRINFQRAILETQEHALYLAGQIVGSYGKPLSGGPYEGQGAPDTPDGDNYDGIIFLYDRGEADGQAFMRSNDEWLEALHLSTQRQGLDPHTKRFIGQPAYDLILFLQSAAFLNDDHSYESESANTNTVRIENEDDAMRSDHRLRAVYGADPAYRFVPCNRNWDTKRLQVLRHVENLIALFNRERARPRSGT